MNFVQRTLVRKESSIIDLTHDDPPVIDLRGLPIMLQPQSIPPRSEESTRSNRRILRRSRPPYQWKGLDKGDGRYRIYQSVSPYATGKIRRRYRRGRLMAYFTKQQLMNMAWKLGITNPEGFSTDDCDVFGIPHNTDAFKLFARGWTNSTKDVLINYIWNRLYDTDAIVST